MANCIIHPGKLDKYGYGVNYAHRKAWIKENGQIPKGLHVLHICDVRACINPEHLFLGTNADNIADRVKKNRSHRPIGELNIKARLTQEQVKFIRNYPKSYGYRKKLSDMFSISIASIADIRNGRTWVGV